MSKFRFSRLALGCFPGGDRPIFGIGRSGPEKRAALTPSAASPVVVHYHAPRAGDFSIAETTGRFLRPPRIDSPSADLRDLFVFCGVAVRERPACGRLWNSFAGWTSSPLESTRFSIGGASPLAARPRRQQRISPAPAAPHLMTDANKFIRKVTPLLMTRPGSFLGSNGAARRWNRYHAKKSHWTWRVRVFLNDRLVP